MWFLSIFICCFFFNFTCSHVQGPHKPDPRLQFCYFLTHDKTELLWTNINIFYGDILLEHTLKIVKKIMYCDTLRKNNITLSCDEPNFSCKNLSISNSDWITTFTVIYTFCSYTIWGWIDLVPVRHQVPAHLGRRDTVFTSIEITPISGTLHIANLSKWTQ